MPSVTRPESLIRCGDWKHHLAMIIANSSLDQNSSCIISLGDSLLAQKQLAAAHFCYHIAGLSMESSSNKYFLFGVDHTILSSGFCPDPEQMVRTEILEYALSLNKSTFLLPHFQILKFSHTLKLAELGLFKKALRYCESITSFIVKDHKKFNPTLLHLINDLSTRLHNADISLGDMESKLPSWIVALNGVIGDIAVCIDIITIC
jgi:hypothetical protein